MSKIFILKELIATLESLGPQDDPYLVEDKDANKKAWTFDENLGKFVMRKASNRFSVLDPFNAEFRYIHLSFSTKRFLRKLGREELPYGAFVLAPGTIKKIFGSADNTKGFYCGPDMNMKNFKKPEFCISISYIFLDSESGDYLGTILLLTS